MSNFQRIDPDISIDGGVSEEGLSVLKTESKNVLYVCTDTTDDQGAPQGFESVKQNFPSSSSIHIPFQPSLLSEAEDKKSLSIQLYRQFETALDSIERPVTIVCLSNRRASAVASAYNGVKHKTPVANVLESANNQSLKFTKSDVLNEWVSTVVQTMNEKESNPILFRQLFDKESSTYSYLLADSVALEAILIDPVAETVDRDIQLIQELGLTLRYVLDTHVHADHVTGGALIKQKLPSVQSVISLASGGEADVKLTEYQPIFFGKRHVYGLHTPGHTAGCFAYVLDDQSKAFTGDALLIRGCGRTDFQGGSASNLYNSVHNKIFKLPKDCSIYPAHDYKGMTSSSVKEELLHNSRLTKSLAEFEKIMSELNLPYPKKIDEAVPRNLKGGL